MKRIQSSSQKVYSNYVNLPILVAINDLTKGEIDYETSQNIKENFKQNIYKDSE